MQLSDVAFFRALLPLATAAIPEHLINSRGASSRLGRTTINSTACTAHARISTSSGEPCSSSSASVDATDCEREHAIDLQHVWDEVVGEHRRPAPDVHAGRVRARAGNDQQPRSGHACRNGTTNPRYLASRRHSQPLSLVANSTRVPPAPQCRSPRSGCQRWGAGRRGEQHGPTGGRGSCPRITAPECSAGSTPGDRGPACSNPSGMPASTVP